MQESSSGPRCCLRGGSLCVSPHRRPVTVTGTIRPEDILVDFEGRTGNVLTGTVGVRTFLGKSYQYEVHTEAGKFLVNRNADESYEEGQTIRLYLPEEKLILMDR